MKGLFRMLARYMGAAVGMGLLLLALNIGLAIGFLVHISREMPHIKDRVSVIAAGVTQQANGNFAVSDTARAALDERYAWTMLLDDAGRVVWSDRMPEHLPRAYTSGEIASFSRWYLAEYPVYVWSDEDGLLVVAAAQGSEWKYTLQATTSTLDALFAWAPAVLLCNLVMVLVLTLLLGWRMYRAAAPIAGGIGRLAAGEDVQLAERGVLRQLAAGLNRASRTLQQQQAALRRRDRTRTEWIAGVSHDIRTPLSLVQGNAAQLEDDASLPAPARAKAKQIREQSQRIGQLVSDLNLASKLEYELQPLHIQPFRPAALLREAAAELLNTTEEGVAALTVAIPPALDAMVVTGDGALLRRAVDNLLRNSVRHNAPPVQISLSLDAEQAHWSITVEDSGNGLDETVLSRLHRASGEAIPAHGLGLVLVQQIVRAHGGTIRFANTTPGLCVTIFLPRSES